MMPRHICNCELCTFFECVNFIICATILHSKCLQYFVYVEFTLSGTNLHV
jgi:hypothetical protein